MNHWKGNLLRKLSLHPTDILLENLTISDLLFHLTGFSWISAKHQQSRGEPVQSMNGPQVLQIVFFSQNKDNSVVTISATRMDLIKIWVSIVIIFKSKTLKSTSHQTDGIKQNIFDECYWRRGVTLKLSCHVTFVDNDCNDWYPLYI